MDQNKIPRTQVSINEATSACKNFMNPVPFFYPE